LSKLEIPAGTSYNLEADTMLVDELVLNDSSKLNLIKPKSYIKANRTVIGAGCFILGVGNEGELGKDGKSFPAPGLNTGRSFVLSIGIKLVEVRLKFFQ